jgi:cytochrome bd ubiquinol oxidase subunit II
MDLGGLWFWLLAAMLAIYVVLDGFDLGAGAILALVARNERERGLVIHSLGPVWDGNEVWLLSAGGALVLAFPRVYAAAFAGFYLPLMLALWLLVFRGISIELHHHFVRTLWLPLFELAFSVSSLLLILILGAALGNVVRGVDADAQGHFFNALFTDFSGRPPLGILDWYTLLAAFTALLALARHGALWLNWKTEGPVQERSARLAGGMGWPLAALSLLLSVASAKVQALVPQALTQNPCLWVFPAAAVGGLAASHLALSKGRGFAAWAGSAVFLAGLLCCAAGGLYPTLLPSLGQGQSLTVANSASSAYALGMGLAWWGPGIALACAYFIALYRSLPAKFGADENAHEMKEGHR